MRDVYKVAKYFVKNDADSLPNTNEGNMKLQSLLVFANMINVAEYGELLFDDEVYVFKNGWFVGRVRLHHETDYSGLKRDSDIVELDFTDSEYAVLNMIMSIFGSASARELSEITHTLNFWKETDCFYKRNSFANMMLYDEEIDRIKEIINAYLESLKDVMVREIINGISFFMMDFN